MSAAEPSDLRGAVDLAGDGFDRITAHIHEFHRAIADLPWRAVAALPASGLARRLHDGITDGVYAAVRITGAAAFGAARAVLRRIEMPAAAPPVARDVIAGALAGFVGDHALRRRNPLMPRLGFYRDGQRLALDRASLARAFPQASSRLVVFVHGLACTEHGWRLYADPAQPQTRPYGDRLADDLGYTPLYVRYNTGLHISSNGRRLAAALAQLVDAWPVRVETLALVGHSMGGLVIRAAAAHAHAKGHVWTTRLRYLVCLGSPHRGAPLERTVDGLTQVLMPFALSRPWARLLQARAVGIRDLKYGATSDADWRDGPTRRWRPARPVARVPQVRYCFIGSSLGASTDTWFAQTLGDGLVPTPSSLAAELADAETVSLCGLHHMQLLNHPAVYAHLRRILGG
ncbi:PGAP1-like protein [Fontimonas thermophila]|uniref:PGAP1-like protein n=1 Tax=Fontimonas thermophila TaxID=1076937 RepID=A0A1I2JFP6_9GAMM|nr:hypothetical protein [Fontimonas thermophila]SFF53662.1 PGAP1-like protein [Fontimonas thermophila]